MPARPIELDSLEESFDPLPTPVSTPQSIDHLLESENDSSGSESIDSEQSTYTAIPHTRFIMPSSSEEFGTPAPRHAAYVTSLLHKTPIKPNLSSSNYVAWSDSVRFGLSAASYNMFLESDELAGTGLDQDRHLATKKCIFHWLLANMETTQSTRFVSMISVFENGIKQTPFSPALLWKTVREYYVSNSESVKLMLRSNITSFSQGSTRDLLEHIKEFRGKIDAFLGANGKMDEEEQARQLVTSLNQEGSERACFFLDAGFITFRSSRKPTRLGR